MGDRKKVLELFEQNEAYIKTRSEACIENHRKKNVVVKVVDQNGVPVRNAKIHVTQKKHAFQYGANLFMLDELETQEKNQRYHAYMQSFGNMATLPFYWDTLEPEKGKPRYDRDSEKIYRRPPIDLCMDFCEKHGIEPREHGLTYEAFFPKWLYDAGVEEIKEAVEKRCSEISQRYAHKIRTIEVTNEMEWEKGKTVFYDAPDFVEWCFKTAEKYFPGNQLVINEHTRACWDDRCRPTDKYYAYIEANMLKGARIDAIGMQYHMFFRREEEYAQTRPYYSPENLYRHMDLYSNFGKPLQVTEVTVPAYSNDAEDEQLQAKILEYLYTIWFGHPNVEQIIYWNMVDGYAHLWDPDPAKIKASQGDMTIGENYYYGGLLRFDLSPKPAYFTVKRLFEEVWHTEEELVSNAAGEICFKGFYGEYELNVDGRKNNFCLNKDSDIITVEV